MPFQLFQRFRRNHALECIAHLDIQSLTRLPLLKGQYFVEWRLLEGGSTSALLNTAYQTRGQTKRVSLENYCAHWDSHQKTMIRLGIGVDGELLPLRAQFTVTQLVEREKPQIIGRLILNLAEYVILHKQPTKLDESQPPRKYRLDQCYYPRATLHLGIRVEQVPSSTPLAYKVPPLNRRMIIPDERDLVELLGQERDIIVAGGKRMRARELVHDRLWRTFAGEAADDDLCLRGHKGLDKKRYARLSYAESAI
ncbi:uncharacterized protein VTP21DRAFT_9559 [Calcarisporiella thermophila]|uniref:uncharacterized protein n=1 Tax=Calcarisporiella thermophila TaxID=911321 RepID=UPI0037436F5D